MVREEIRHLKLFHKKYGVELFLLRIFLPFPFFHKIYNQHIFHETPLLELDFLDLCAIDFHCPPILYLYALYC